MKILMLDTVTFGDDIDLSYYDELGEVIAFYNSTQDEAVKRVREHNPDVIINNKVILNERVLSAAPSLKMIAETATGYNNVDLEYAKAHGIRVANVAGYSTQSVIQHTFALMFYVLEKLNYYDTYVKSGEYTQCPCFTHFAQVFPELYGKTWGIVGLGAIGRGVAGVAEAFGCRVVYYSASGNTYDTKYEAVGFEELLAQSDIISIHAPLNDYTHHLFNYEAMTRMKSSAILLNLGRGPIVNEADLVRALDENLIKAAGLDVIEQEPMAADSVLRTFKDSNRLIVTPHIAWATYEARSRLMKEVYLNIQAYFNGEERNVIV